MMKTISINDNSHYTLIRWAKTKKMPMHIFIDKWILSVQQKKQQEFYNSLPMPTKYRKPLVGTKIRQVCKPFEIVGGAMSTKRIPITEAKKISEAYGQDQVIIVTWDKTGNRTHVVTYGKSVKDCEQAAIGGNFVKKALGWPEEECNAVPARVRRKALKSAG